MRRRRSKVFAVIAGVALASLGAACSVFTSLDGLTGGTTSPDSSASGDDASPTGDDGSVTPGDGAGSEDAGGGEASVEDAPLGFDAGEGGAFCASQTTAFAFCDDFDQDPFDAAAFTAPWDQITQTGGSVVRTGGVVTSPPFAMLSTADSPVQASIDLAAYKIFPALTKSTQLTLTFDIYVDAADKTKSSDAVLAAIELVGTLGQRWALQLETSYEAADGGGALDVLLSENRSPTDGGGSGYTSHPVSQKLPLGAWTRVAMEASVSAVGGTATIALHFGTVEVAKDTVIVEVLAGQPEILVGLTYASISNQGWAVRYDDVTFDIH